MDTPHSAHSFDGRLCLLDIFQFLENGGGIDRAELFCQRARGKFLSALVPGQGVEISEHVIRKLAHFCEYALLGFLLFFTYLSYTRKKLWFFIPSLVGIVIPFCDEGLQFFSDGRAPSFKDVGIDVSGAAFGFLCAWAVYFVVLSIVRAKRKKSCKG